MKTKILRSYALTLLRSSILTLLLSCALTVLNAQIEIKELNLTPEIEEMAIEPIKYLYEKGYSNYGIADRAQLENLRLGKPIPNYWIVGENIEYLSIWDASRISDGVPLSLSFINTWTVPVMLDEAPLLFVVIASSGFIDGFNGIKNTKEHFHNYELKDSIIGSIGVSEKMDYLIIRKENQDVFVEIYDEVTDEYFKNEYRFSELINHLKEVGLRKRKEEMEAQRRYYEKVANKSELNMTPEITEMLNSFIFSQIKNLPEDAPRGFLATYGATNRSQLTNLQFGKPIPKYSIEDENLTFTGYWEVPMISADNELLCFQTIKLEDNGQYGRAGGSARMAELVRNYEYKDLIIGILNYGKISCLIIRKENQDIFQMYDYATREYLKNEYSFSEILNLLKK